MDAACAPKNYLPISASCLKPPCCFLETLACDTENKTTLLFKDFANILTFRPGDDLDAFFRKLEDYLDKQYWLAGYFSYEFGYFLEEALCCRKQYNNIPLVWLGVSKSPQIITITQKSKYRKPNQQLSYTIDNLKPNITKDEYSRQIKKIKHYLEEGLTYQVNFTFKLKFDFKGNALGLYLSLRETQPTAYAAFIDSGSEKIISLSPELFFRINGNKIITRPMKGTAKRGFNPKEDKRAKNILKNDKKIKAENIMIVDLLRNDLGRIAERVSTPKIFNIEKYRTLYQMTSTIEARLKENLKLKDIFYSLFPSGSVTGAPKIKTMQIINNLEKEPRGIYTGAIGYISPERDACFNVAIRTIQIKGKKGELGIGGGIVYDSLARSEYAEALLKAKFFTENFPRINLIETILLNQGRYFLLNAHLRRLKESCRHFGIPLDIPKLKDQLKIIKVQEKRKLKVRVLVDREANLYIEKEGLKKIKEPVKVKISSQRVDPNNQFLYHKTTQRAFYDKEKKKAENEGFFEVIFLNQRNELSEGAISNLFILKGKKLYTPPIKCGLLPGVLREHLLKKRKAEEKILYLEDLLAADKIYIGNSLRGLLEADCQFTKIA